MPSLSARVFDSSGNLVGNGEIYKVIGLTYTQRLDEAGKFNLVLVLADDRNINTIAKGYTIRIYDDHEEVFYGVIEKREKRRNQLAVSGSDLMIELSYLETGINHVINAPATTALNDIVALFDGWTISVDSNSFNAVAELHGKTGLGAIKDVARQFGYHFRRGTDRHLDVGAFGADSGVTFSNGSRPHGRILEQPEVLQNDDEIINRVIPLGGNYNFGTDTTLTIQTATNLPAYPIGTRTRNGATEYYIEDTNSIGIYGVREQVQSFPEIKPGLADLVPAAANSLKSRAVSFLEQYSMPQNTYQIKVYDIHGVNVGDLIEVWYSDENQSIRSDFYVTEIQTNYQAGVSYSLIVSDVNRVRLNDFDILASSLSKLQALQLKDIT